LVWSGILGSLEAANPVNPLVNDVIRPDYLRTRNYQGSGLQGRRDEQTRVGLVDVVVALAGCGPHQHRVSDAVQRSHYVVIVLNEVFVHSEVDPGA